MSNTLHTLSTQVAAPVDGHSRKSTRIRGPLLRSCLLGLTLLAGSVLAPASAQSKRGPASFEQDVRTPAVSAPAGGGPSGGGLLTPGWGGDSCGTPDVLPSPSNMNTGTAPTETYSFDNSGATVEVTGEGQAEPLCDYFTSTVVANDVWFEWLATFDGPVVMTTVGGTTVDTKIAAYPAGGCPQAPSALACNDDDAFSYQSTISWVVTSGTTYLLQLGTFPTSSGGAGTFDLYPVVLPPCGTKDTGVSDSGLRPSTSTYDYVWMKKHECLATVDGVGVAFCWTGTASPLPAGTAYDACVWEDLDADGDDDPTTPAPHGALSLLYMQPNVVVSPATDTIEYTSFPPVAITGTAYVGVRMYNAAWAGHVPAATDSSLAGVYPTSNYSAAGPAVDPMDISLTTAEFYNPGVNFMVRATGTEHGATLGTPVCFGDGSHGSCPCNNYSQPGAGEGCAVHAGIPLGAFLQATGSASVLSDTLQLCVYQATPLEFGIFVQNLAAVYPGTPFYDGLICLPVDSHLVRHYSPPACSPTTTDAAGHGCNAQPLTACDFLGDTLPGVTIYYQYWFRSNTGACASGANFSSGLGIPWHL